LGLKETIGLVLLTVSPAVADPLNFRGKDYLEMNETYRTGFVHGVMASWVDLGSPERYREFILAGYGCLDRRPRTIPVMASELAKYIESHPNMLQAPASVAFTTYFLDCPEK